MYKSSQSPPLYNFLNNFRVKKGEPHTHTSMGTPLGSFYIPENKSDEFYTLYKEHIEAGNTAHIIEKHKEYSSILIDIDFKFNEDVKERQYTKDHIDGLIEIYHDVISDLLTLPNKSNDLIAFVFQKDSPYLANKVIKDGIHIMYPFIVTLPAIQYLIRDNVIKKIKETHLFDNIPTTNPLSDIVDKSVIYKNGWLMMKSSKPNCESYKPTIIYNESLNKIAFDEIDYRGMSDNVGKFFSIRRYTEEDASSIKNEDLLSKYNTKKISYKYKSSSFKTMGEKEYIINLLGILSPERYDNFEKWIEVGICLNSISQCDESYKIWDDFSKKSSKYDEESTRKKWEEITDSNKNRKEITMGSLVYWAKTDNEKAFMALKRNDIRKKIQQTLKSPTHWDIASVLHEMYKGQYIFADKMWYYYKDHRWTQDLDAFCLRSKISKELVGEYLIIMSENNEKSGELSDDDDDSQNNEIMTMNKKIMEIVKNLKNSSFKDNVTKECKELFQDKDFIAKLDTNEYLLGFENGVYDLSKMEFRDGRPDDYLTFTTGNDYAVNYDEDPCIEDIENFMDQLISDEEVKEYTLLLLASMLQGINAEEKFRIWTGSGGNGKSKLLELFITSFGEYCIKFPVTLLTGRRAASNAPTPEISQSKGKRFGYFDEPNEDERINIGLMKEFSGNDKIKCRGLHQAPIEFKPQFKMILLCNALPKVPPDDEGCWRRMEVVEFKNKFVENPVADNEYPRDYQLSSKLKEWKNVFLSWLINKYYSKYQKMTSLTVPGEVVNFTQDYQKQMDLYTEFIDDVIAQDSESTDILTFTEIHKVFKDWFSDNYTSSPPNKKELTKQIQKKFKKPILVTTGLKGCSLKNTIVEEEEYCFE